ncbi:SDR family NAD(P)-dependent oxidoreductase [Saccharothrix sp. BKS2]|uniref:SDR family NAD(P)-dependent oxidoreductase n=1 Tax=Saccharothrix sp. BKS2 TaxID=3064400 RepID=UPI0039E931BB
MVDNGSGARAPGQDLAAIGRLAGAVRGVREAVAVADRRVRSSAAPAGPPAEAPPIAGTPVPGDRPAFSAGPEPTYPRDAVGTLAEGLLRAAELVPGRGTTYVSHDGSTDRQTYAELLDEALRALTGLRAAGLGPGDAVLLQCADPRAFVTGFWACVLGGVLPTPVGPAPDYRSDNAVTRKLHAAWQLLDQPLVLTDTGLRDRVAGLGALWGVGDRLRVASLAELTADVPAEPATTHPDQPVLNLLTSGSTGTPKCVRHANRSVVARSYTSAQVNGFTEDEVTLNFFPLDHVGGIVMSNARDVLLRCEHVNAPTETFIQRPVVLLDWIDRFRTTNCWAPNFAYALVNKHSAEIGAGSWDLSTMRHIFNAGEAVVARTAHRFLELLTPHGLPADAMTPGWGMSETSSGVTYTRMHAADPGVGTVSLDPGSLDGQLVVVPHGTPRSVVLTEVGPPIPGVSLRVVDEDGRVLPEGRVGRLHVAGNTLMLGYYRNEEANRAGFVGDGWFDTGDLAFLRDGGLTLTGREKDLVIVNGANYPASDIEAVVEQVAGVRPACAAACGVHDEETGTDAVLVFFVPAEDTTGDLDGTVAAIRQAVSRELAMRPRAIVPVTAAEFPRTASGKIQRNLLLDAYRDGRFDGREHDRTADRGAADEEWVLSRAWEPVGTPEPVVDDRPVLLYAPAGSALDEHLARLLPDARVGVVTPGEAFRVVGPCRVEVDPLDPAQHDRALAHLVRDLGVPGRVVHAWESGAVAGSADHDVTAQPVGSSAAATRAADHDAPVAGLVVGLAALSRAVPDVDVTVLTRHALGVDPADEVEAGRTALTALVRSAAAEGTVGAVRLVDVPPGADEAETTRLALARYGTDLVGVRRGTGHAPRLRLVDRADELGIPREVLRPGGTCLVVGGLGGLGRIVSEYLLASVGARLLVTGRTPGADLARTGADAVLADLRDLGDVRYAAADVADAAALEAAVAGAEEEWGRPLDLVIHVAGASAAPQWTDLASHELVRETVPWLRTMLHCKLAGGAAVESLLDRRPGTAVVLFSSANGFFGGSAFGAYAAANAALDGFAHRWAARGHYVRCLAWSMWEGVGMSTGSPLAAAARRRGLRLIDPSEGLSLLLSALNQPHPYVLIGADARNTHVKPHLAADQFEGGSTVVAVVPDGSADPEAVRADVAGALAEHGDLVQVLVLPRISRDAAGAPDVVRILAHRDSERRVSRYAAPEGPTEAVVAGVFGEHLARGRVGRDDSVFGLGGDSIKAMQVAGALSERFGRALPVPMLYEHPTVRELAAAIDSTPVGQG